MYIYIYIEREREREREINKNNRINNPDTSRASHVGRCTAGQLGGAGPAGWDADGFVRAGHNRPSCPPAHRREMS